MNKYEGWLLFTLAALVVAIIWLTPKEEVAEITPVPVSVSTTTGRAHYSVHNMLGGIETLKEKVRGGVYEQEEN